MVPVHSSSIEDIMLCLCRLPVHVLILITFVAKTHVWRGVSEWSRAPIKSNSHQICTRKPLSSPIRYSTRPLKLSGRCCGALLCFAEIIRSVSLNVWICFLYMKHNLEWLVTHSSCCTSIYLREQCKSRHREAYPE
jgi:hypothetical protein